MGIESKTAAVQQRADELAESFVNGNISFVVDAVTKTRPTAKACYLALKVANKLPADDVDRFRRAIFRAMQNKF